MQRSTERILTTHTGSLPRPEALTQLYVKRSRGEPVDEAEIERIGRDAVRDVVAKQREAGIDIGNNGEQQRDSFFLYLRSRLSGLGGSWTRPTRGDVDRYPEFQKLWARQYGGTVGVSNLMGIPKAIGEVDYLDDKAINDECRAFQVRARRKRRTPSPSRSCARPRPASSRWRARTSTTTRSTAYLAALGRALQVEYDAIVKHGYLLQIDAPDLALERHITYKDQPVSAFQEFVEKTDRDHQRRARQRAARPRAPACLLGQFGIAARPRRAARGHPADPAEGQGRRLRAAVRQSAPRPRVQAVQDRCRSTSDQILVAGVIDSLTNFVEHPEVVADRIERVAAVVGDPTRVQAGTDCGFDTSAGWGRVAGDVVWAKLRSLSEGARLASQRLF